MRYLVIAVTAALLTCVSPAMAQDAGQARRESLVDRYLELSMGDNMRSEIERSYKSAFEDSDLPAEETAWWTQQGTTMIQRVLAATFDDVRDDMAELYTEAELEAMIDFIDTPEGRSITNKQFRMGTILQEALAPHLQAEMTALVEKYCTRFECEDEASPTASKPQ